jgi:hypothetical protein
MNAKKKKTQATQNRQTESTASRKTLIALDF